MKLQLGSRVVIAPSSKYYVTGDKDNPINIPGTIDNFREDMEYCGVKWDNGTHNGYNKKDLLPYNEQPEIKNNYQIF